MSWNFVALVFGRKSLKNVNNITHTLFYSSEKELSKPTKFRVKLNISPLIPSQFFSKN